MPLYLAITRRKVAFHLCAIASVLTLLFYVTIEWRKAVRTKNERAEAIGVFKLKPGPWGDISCVPITISPPLEFVPESSPPSSKPLAWRFPRINRESLVLLLAQVKVSAALRQTLLAQAQADAETGGLVIYPTAEQVLGLSPDDRAHLYFGLAQFAENPEHARAFRFCGPSTEEWFHDVKLAPATLRLVSPLVYRIGRFLFFADLRTVEPQIASAAERKLLLKALSQESTFLMKLNVPANANIDALVQYWGWRGQAKDIRPILESLAGIQSDEDGEDIGISHLLPPFARRRIYTYPVPAEAPPAINRDCHWTALNFFSDPPSDELCDPLKVAKLIVSGYHRVYSDFRVGDVALFFNGPDTYFHSAVYIADDVYFTKNGSLATRPWMLMRLSDLQDYYPSLTPIEVRHYRRNDL